MKSKDSLRTSVLRMIKSAIRNKEVEKNGSALDDDRIIRLLGMMVKQRKDSIEKFQAGNRPDLASKEEAEIVILEEYLPSPITREAIEAHVGEAISETGATSPRDFGKVMKTVMASLSGQVVDGKLVGEIVKAHLNQE